MAEAKSSLRFTRKESGVPAEQSGVELIKLERKHQMAKGWTPDHDDNHRCGMLAKRAAELAVNGTDAQVVDDLDEVDCWGLVKKHKNDRRRQLVIAGALIAAEIDRIQRRRSALTEKRWMTHNRLICGLMWWFYESHGAWPKRIWRVYSFREYFTFSGHHIWIENLAFWHTLYRAVGMIFPACKRLWDRGETKLWPEDRRQDEYQVGTGTETPTGM